MTRLPALTLLALLLGLLTVLLLPVLFVTWLQSWIIATREPTDWIDELEASLTHTCGDCGAGLQIVRPGKYQCPRCE